MQNYKIVKFKIYNLKYFKLKKKIYKIQLKHELFYVIL